MRRWTFAMAAPGIPRRFPLAQVSFSTTPCLSFPGLPLLVPDRGPLRAAARHCPRWWGWAYALAIAQCASLQGGPQRTLAVIAADALSAQWLADDIPVLRHAYASRCPRLENAALRPFLAAPGPGVGAPRNPVSPETVASATWWRRRPRRRCTGCRRPPFSRTGPSSSAGRPAGFDALRAQLALPATRT